MKEIFYRTGTEFNQKSFRLTTSNKKQTVDITFDHSGRAWGTKKFQKFRTNLHFHLKMVGYQGLTKIQVFTEVRGTRKYLCSQLCRHVALEYRLDLYEGSLRRVAHAEHASEKFSYSRFSRAPQTSVNTCTLQEPHDVKKRSKKKKKKREPCYIFLLKLGYTLPS